MLATARRSLLAICFAALAAAPIHAIQLPGPDVPALLRINSVRTIFFGPNIAQVRHEQILISRGGGLFSLLGTGVPGSTLFIDVFRGLATKEELATLGRALVEAQVGVQGDCTSGQFGLGHIEITWYGRTGRQRTFRVVLHEESPPGTECPAAVVLLVSAIERFVGDAVSGFPQG